MGTTSQEQLASRDKHVLENSSSGWRVVCRQQAFAAAEAEDRESWGIIADKPADVPVPFYYRWEHVQDVVRHALWLAEQTGADVEIVEAAAWLHDVRKTAPRHGEAGAVAAEQILEEIDFPPEKVAAVTDAIRKHVGLTREPRNVPLQPLEAAVLWDADKLSKIGVQALASHLSSTYVVNKPLAQRRVESVNFAENVLRESVASMNTDAARRLAERRYDEMMQVFAWWAQDEQIGT